MNASSRSDDNGCRASDTATDCLSHLVWFVRPGMGRSHSGEEAVYAVAFLCSFSAF